MKEKNIKLNILKWDITKKCNFNCHYCGVIQEKDDLSKPIEINKLSESLELLKGSWKFDITGGEPFLEEKIIEICSEISKKHIITLNTNLSTPNVFAFADNINPEKVIFNSSVHIPERTKSHLDSYIEKVLYLQKKGFCVLAGYVAHPDLFDRMESDISYLKSEGIKNISIKIFNGLYKDKIYPFSFTSEEKDFLKNFEACYPEFELLNRRHNYYGKPCFAGQNIFKMDRYGNLSRCSSVNDDHGNFFDKTMRFNSKPELCSATEYLCLHECFENCINESQPLLYRLKKWFFKKKNKHLT
jgi:MoaA/NifB/PqqE/SkfB family radical SAM enzyme